MGEKNRIITISRQFGSGGRTVGKLTAERLNIPCYDGDFIDHVVAANNFTEEYVKEYGEYFNQGIINAILGRTGGLTKQDELWVLQRKTILDLAKKGPCVFVGHCADYILQDVADCLKVFIHADLEKRAERIVRVYGERDIMPKERLMLKDRRRMAYCKYYTDMDWGKMENYHLTLDSGILGIDRCAEILAQLH